MLKITRLEGAAKGRSRAVAHGGLVYTVATGAGAGVAEQTRAALAAIDRNLGDAGADKTRILRATVYLRDMTTKEEMDAVWRDWIGGVENWPQRACVGADLAGSDLVEIVVTAAAFD